MLVASPRNQHYLVQEVVGLRRPFVFLGPGAASREGFPSERCAVDFRGFKRHLVDQTADRLSGSCQGAFIAFKCVARAGYLLAIEVCQAWVEERRRFGFCELPFQLGLALPGKAAHF
jgi:hypothetical protein